MAVVFFVFGLMLGSFFNVVIYRLPRGESVAYPNSHCPKCKTPLSSKELIPVISYLSQRGKCRNCGVGISMQYPLVELLTGLTMAGLYSQLGLTPGFVTGFVFVALLLVMSVIDLRQRILPNLLTLPGIILAVLFSLLGWTIPLTSSLLGIVIGGGILLLIAILSRGGMGMGDVKLMAMIGAFLGGWFSLISLFWASVLGSVIGIAYLIYTKQGRRTPIPFGPFLSAGALLVYIWFFVI